MAGQIRLTILGLGAILLSACESLPLVGGEFSSGGDDQFARGSALAYRLTAADERALSVAFIEAMETGDWTGWQGPRASGAVSPGGWSLANLKPDPAVRVPAARDNLDLHASLETELGLYVLTRNANVRVGPGTEYGVAEILPSGAGLDIVGKTVRDKWMLVAHEGKVRGYVSESLMIKAPGTELELAGGPRRRAALCREFVQHLGVDSERDEWRGAACRNENGEWRLAAEPAPPPEEQELELLLVD